MAEETVEEVTEAPTVGSKENASKAPSEAPSEASKETTYTCSLCGASVVPQRVETPSGVRYKCPKCKKFMKPLTPPEVAEREEEAKGPLPPLEVLVTGRVKELLVKELPAVYGIPKKDKSQTITAIIDTLTPEQATDEWNLHTHIKKFARNANDEHLESVIEKIFWQLEEDGYLPREQDQRYQPRYGRGRRKTERQPGYARRERRRRDDREDDEDRTGRSGGMVIYVDGQPVDTDYEGYMAYQRYKREEGEERRRAQEYEAEGKRRAEEHELRMKKLEAEILKITAETGGSKSEPLVKVKVGEEEQEVPASIAPFYLKGDDKELKEMQDKLEKEREERHQAEIKRLEDKIDEKKEPLVKVKIGEQEQEVPANVAHLYLKGEDKELKDLESKLEREREQRLKERDERHQGEMKRLEEKIDGQPSFLEQLEYYERTGQRLGLRQTGRTTMDVLDSFRGDLQTTAQQILNKIPTPGAEFRPEVTRTPEERRKAAESIKRKLERSEDILQLEDELVRSASRVKSS